MSEATARGATKFQHGDPAPVKDLPQRFRSGENRPIDLIVGKKSDRRATNACKMTDLSENAGAYGQGCLVPKNVFDRSVEIGFGQELLVPEPQSGGGFRNIDD
jgi:hypothetical protein